MGGGEYKPLAYAIILLIAFYLILFLKLYKIL